MEVPYHSFTSFDFKKVMYNMPVQMHRIVSSRMYHL